MRLGKAHQPHALARRDWPPALENKLLGGDPARAFFPSCAREETPESRGMPCLFLNTERGFGGKPPQKSGFRRHLAGSKMPKEGSKMPKETFFHGDLPLESGRAARARCLGFLAGVAAEPAALVSDQSRQHRYLVPPGDGVLRKAVQAERQPYSGALLQHLEAQPVGRNELGLHIRHPAYRPDPTIPRRRHQPADQWRSERRRDPCTFRLGCHAPLCLTADAERPPAEEIMSIGGAHGARRGTGHTYLDCRSHAARST